MRFVAGFVLGVVVALIGHSQTDQIDKHSRDLQCDLRPSEVTCQ